MNQNYWTYILECSDGSFYTGMTKNLKQRIMQHNGLRKGGARYTRTRQPVIVRYYEIWISYREAAQRENQLKKLTHQQKANLCNSFIIPQT